MKNLIVCLSFLLLFITKTEAQISPNGNTGASTTNYTNGEPNDPIFIWCGDDLANNAGSLTATPPWGTGPFTFNWFYHNENTHSWIPYQTTTGSTSTLNNLPSDGYKVEIRDNQGNVVACYNAWVWNMNAEVTASANTVCNSVELNGDVSVNSSFTYYNPPPSQAIITSNTQITVCFSAIHTYVSDLAFYMAGPGGSPTILLSPNPGAIGQGPICNSNNNVNGLCFSSASTNNFNACVCNVSCSTTQTSNYTGVYGSYGPNFTPINWSPLYGINAAQGGWTVQIYDCIGADVGYLSNASITFSNLETTCGGPDFISYNSGGISSTINDNSCSASTASIFEVPLDMSSYLPITIDAIVSTSWASTPSVAINDPNALVTSADNLSEGNYDFTLNVVVIYGGAMCIQSASDSANVFDTDHEPEFDLKLGYCRDEPADPLPTTSSDGASITGTWSPSSVDTSTEGTITYTFTPDDDQCAAEVSFDITVGDKAVVEFNQLGPYCRGTFVPSAGPANPLKNTSLNGIPGSWSPPAINTSSVGTTIYTFTPSGDQCADPFEMSVEVFFNEPEMPSNLQLVYCVGETINFPLPHIQGETTILTGIWTNINNSTPGSRTATFIPDAGQCTRNMIVSYTVKPIIATAFDPIPPICAGDSLILPTTSTNGVIGTWLPAINNQQTTEYTFTPNSNANSEKQCAETFNMTVVVNQPSSSAFGDFPDFITLCEDEIFVLPSTSSNGISGTWSPSTVDTSSSMIGTTTDYTFTPDEGLCALPYTISIMVSQPNDPDFTQITQICEGDVLDPLPTTSLNGISGTWSPAINNQQTTEYTFTPDFGFCANEFKMTIDVEPKIVPTFDPFPTICSGEMFTLPTISTNGVPGSWSPAPNYTQTTDYTFTPNAGICAHTYTMSVTVNQPVTPVFTQVAPICKDEFLAPLPTTSIDGISGTWSPAIDNQTTQTYTFTPNPDECALLAYMTIEVKPWHDPLFDVFMICAGDPSPLPNISNNGITGTWSPAFDNMAEGVSTYTFTPNDPNQCGLSGDFTVTVIGSVTVPTLPPLEYCDPNSDGFGQFDLTQVIPIIESVNTVSLLITFHETEHDAEFNANNLDLYNPITAYPNGQPYNQTIYVRIGTEAGCFGIATLDLIVHDLPKITNAVTLLENCDDNTDGFALFDLTNALPDILNGLNPSLHTISYHTSQADAKDNVGAIMNFTNYTNTTPDSQTIWVRVEENAIGCFNVAEVTLIVNKLPNVDFPEVDRYILCDDDTDGFMEFDLSSKIEGITGGQTGLTVTFYDTFDDAENQTNPYPALHVNNQTPTETVFVRVETEKGCYLITLMDLVVEPLPVLVPPSDPVTVCDSDADTGDGFNKVDFTEALDKMLSGSNPNDYEITIHETFNDAELGSNAIPDTQNYYNTNPFTQIVYVRVEAKSGEKCFTIYPLTISVIPVPKLPTDQDGQLPDVAICDDNTDGFTYFDLSDQTTYILNSQQDVTNLVVTYHVSEQDAIDGIMAITTPDHYPNVSNPQTLWVRLENTISECFNVASFDLIVNLPLDLPVPLAITICDEDMDGSVTFDLTVRIPDILVNTFDYDNFDVDFFTSYASAEQGILADLIANPSAYTSSVHTKTLGVRVTNKTTGCESYTILDVRRAPMPNVPSVPLTVLEGCQQVGNPNLEATFDLTLRENFIRQGDMNIIITYHLTQADAETDANAIAVPENYGSEDTIIYIRVANPPNGGVVCYRILELPIIVNPLPIVAKSYFAICEEDSPGFADFDFLVFNLELLGSTQNTSDFTISYYPTQTDAENQTNPIDQSATYQNQQPSSEQIWVRITNKSTDCFVIEIITLYAEEAAQATDPSNNTIFECDDWDGVNDGFVSEINLTIYQSEILNGQDPSQFLVSYHTSEADAETGSNAISSPNNFTNTVSGGQTIWVRVENSNTQAPCYALTELEIIIEQPAQTVISTSDNVLCVDWKTSEVQNPVILDSGVTEAGYTFQWYHNGTLIAGETGSTLTLDELGDQGFYKVIATSNKGCVSEESTEFEVILSGIAEIMNITTTRAFEDEQNIIVTVEGHGEYAFQLDNGPLQDNGYFVNVPPGVHTVTVYDITLGDINLWNSCGNASISDIQIIDYPRFFTPNEDGYNDRWNVTGFTEFHQAEIFIFDRYGKLLKQLNPLGEGWDGTFKGKQVPSTDYWFKVEYNEEDVNNLVKRREFKAHFSLKR